MRSITNLENRPPGNLYCPMLDPLAQRVRKSPIAARRICGFGAAIVPFHASAAESPSASIPLFPRARSSHKSLSAHRAARIPESPRELLYCVDMILTETSDGIGQ